MSTIRCTDDVMCHEVDTAAGQICQVYTKFSSRKCHFVQYLNPLSPEQPYFSAQIKSLAADSTVTFGIAGPDIDPNIQPGHWLHSVGYESDTGKCYTSHHCVANTQGETLQVGDVLGVLINYFGDKKSTVTFLKNGSPVATRFHFEPNHNHYLPTISIECGPVDLDLMWPPAAAGHVPLYSEKSMLNWIYPNAVKCDAPSNSFVCCSEGEIQGELIIQCPHPLGQEWQHFEIFLSDSSTSNVGPSLMLVGCSPLHPPAASSLAKDYIRFDLDSNAGHRLGMGIHYNPGLCGKPDFNPKAEQLVYCYVTADMKIISGHMILQPEGGLYPVVILTNKASRVTVDVESNCQPVDLKQLLDISFQRELIKANKEMLASLRKTEVKEFMLRKSKHVEVTVLPEYCRLHLSHDRLGTHVVQFRNPLVEGSSYFLVCIRSLCKESTVGVGVAGRDFPLNEFPGKLTPSVGWISQDGKLYRNSRCDGNLSGDKYREGDMVTVQMVTFAKNMSVALFTKNLHPVGTVYYTQSNRADFLPTIALCSNGSSVVIDVFWQNVVQAAPAFSVINLEHWCLPAGSTVDHRTNTVYVKDHHAPVAIQAPYSLHKGFNHFEVRLTKHFSSHFLPPAIILSTATPLEPPPKSCLKLDYLRFWAVDQTSSLVQVGDLVGWGLLYIDDSLDHEEQLVICYLTVNRKILLVRVVYQPPGGFYPLVVLPSGLNEVTMEFNATYITHNPISKEDADILVTEAKQFMEREAAVLRAGGDPVSELTGIALFRPLPQKETKKQDGLQSECLNQLDNTITGIAVTENRQANMMGKIVKGSAFKQLKRPSIRISHDHRSSVSCVLV
ncbi:unnamed protein product [Candidula unifasciata]|uniref:B30.2/SPRY domain-containing protein n=1 Tax=Candidula unifasciata TaxID=100452 RepID=A0A8S3ZWW4_9EUPU|nr:unnamed protein product [Candidula unifasciata]